MKYLSIVFFTCISCFLMAQNNSFEFYAAPNKVGLTKSTVAYDQAFSYSFGVGYNHALSEKLSLTAGLRFSDFVTKYSNDELRWGTQHDGSGGVDPGAPSGESITGITFKNHYYYFEVPLGVKYNLLNKNFRLFVEPTINPSLYLTHRNDIEKRYGEGVSTTEIESNTIPNIRKVNLFGELALGAEFNLTDKVHLQIRPGARMQLLPTATGNNNGAKWYSYFVKFGINYLLD